MLRRMGQEQTPFDTWLHRDLMEAHGSSLREPLSDELWALLASVPERNRDN